MKKSKLLVYLIISMMLVSVPALYAYADNEQETEAVSDNEASDESEDEAIVIEINSAQEFLDFAKNCKEDSYSNGVVFKLLADIDLSGEDFEGVPYFNGIFEGQGHTINFGILKVKGSNQGFIRYIGSAGIVRELNLKGKIAAEGSQNAIGGLVGVNKGIVSKCNFEGEVGGENNVGGICGINKEGATISGCTNYANVLATNYTGGICGRNEGTVTLCSNSGDINTEELDSSLDLGAVDVGALNITQNVMNRNDTGGITGYSSGAIRMCKNYGQVGYIHTGYNVGGIVGRQDGVVSVCSNHGIIYGRKDVGGIVGQAAPYIESDYLSDKVDKTREDINSLNDTLSGISSTISNTSAETRKYAEELNDQYKETLDSVSVNLADMSASVLEAHPEAQEYVDNVNTAMSNVDSLNDAREKLNPEDFEDMDEYIEENQRILDEIQNNMDVVDDNLEEINKLYDEAGSSSDEFLSNISEEIAKSKTAETVDDMIVTIDNGTQQVLSGFDSAINQTNDIVNNLSDDLDYLLNDDNNYIEDISSVSVPTDMRGVISYCVNRGEIDGDINAGGIAGIMNVEYDVDPEYDLDMTETLNVKVRSTVNDVIIHCINYGNVNTKKDYAGGTTGHQELGLIFDCESYGTIAASDGNMLGGIAGYSASSILKSYSFCRLDGGDNIGGIVGEGYTVQDCITVCNIISEGECLGAVVGYINEEGSVKNNLFVSDALEGIDGISYMGIAEHVAYDVLMDEYNVPSGFRMVTIDFVADDACVEQLQIRYGSGLDENEIPEAPEKEGYYVEWNLENAGEGIYNNIVIEAEYKPWKKSVASDETVSAEGQDGNNSKPVFIIAGNYYDGTSVSLEPAEGPILSDKDTTLYAYSWKLISDKGLPTEASMVEGHFYGYGNEKNAKVYIRYDGQWQQVLTQVDGGYLVAVVPIDGEFAVVVSEKDYRYLYTYMAVGACALLTVLLIFVKKKEKNKAKSKDKDLEKNKE